MDTCKKKSNHVTTCPLHYLCPVGEDERERGVPVTQCGQQQRQICAEDRCKVGTGDMSPHHGT